MNCFSCAIRNDQCTGCNTGYFLFDSKCEEFCPLRTYISDDKTKCLDCSESQSCLQCNN